MIHIGRCDHLIQDNMSSDQWGVDELKRAKIDVKMLTFLQFLLHFSMWCHFNGM
jgi:hypothetical protein